MSSIYFSLGSCLLPACYDLYKVLNIGMLKFACLHLLRDSHCEDSLVSVFGANGPQFVGSFFVGANGPHFVVSLPV